MKRNRNGIWSDVALLAFLLLCTVCLMFGASNPGGYIQNLILLNIAFLLVVITYFTSVTVGLLLNIVFIFSYGSFILYQTVTAAAVVGVQTYFWLVMTPMLTGVIAVFTSSSRGLQEENELLKKQKATLVTLDENTDLKNSLSFQKDLSVFTGISIRYEIPLTLLVLKVKYWNEIRRFVHEDELAETVFDISKIGQSSIRTNDTLYMLDKDNATWGLLLFSDKEGAKVVMERIRQKLYDFNNKEFADKYKVKLILKIGAVQYDHDTIRSPLEFVEQAQKQLEYDV